MTSHWERQLSDPEGSSTPLLVIAAHPDDETVGIGGTLPRLRNVNIICATDGSPRNLLDAMAAGCETREAYAQLRAAELDAAMRVAGVPEHRIHRLGVVDQEAAHRLAELTDAIARHVRQLTPAIVVTHPYEGGHPDHDAVAFAVQHACMLLRGEGQDVPVIVEMTSYHLGEGGMKTGQFLNEGTHSSLTIELDEAQRQNKEHMFECYRSQAHVLKYFPIDKEKFRVSPQYDFLQPAHAGELWYELFDWGLRREQWTELVREALSELSGSAPRGRS